MCSATGFASSGSSSRFIVALRLLQRCVMCSAAVRGRRPASDLTAIVAEFYVAKTHAIFLTYACTFYRPVGFVVEQASIRA